MSNETARAVGGGCVIRFTATMPTLFRCLCHCSMCRRNHGSGYATWLAVLRSQVSIDRGAGLSLAHISRRHGRYKEEKQ